MATREGDPKRNRMLGVVHMATKQLGIADDDYREILYRITGCRSARDCTPAQLHRLIVELERLGYRGNHYARRSVKPANHPVARKARALWLGLHALGAVKDPSERALEKFCKRQLGVDRLHWADQSRAFPLIEALKAMAEKEGWRQAIPARTDSAEVGRILNERLYDVLTARLTEYGVDRQWPKASSFDVKALYDVVAELGVILREVREQ